MKNRMWSNQFRTTTVCVDSYEDGIFAGRVYHPVWENGQSFKSLTQFLVLIEQLLDDMDFPQSYNEPRCFASAKGLPKDTGTAKEALRGELKTFTIQILFRQHASWQGCATWEETQKMQSFRSVLELVLLLDSALREEAA